MTREQDLDDMQDLLGVQNHRASVETQGEEGTARAGLINGRQPIWVTPTWAFDRFAKHVLPRDLSLMSFSQRQKKIGDPQDIQIFDLFER